MSPKIPQDLRESRLGLSPQEFTTSKPPHLPTQVPSRVSLGTLLLFPFLDWTRMSVAAACRVTGGQSGQPWPRSHNFPFVKWELQGKFSADFPYSL
jgi:hypothetical protein